MRFPRPFAVCAAAFLTAAPAAAGAARVGVRGSLLSGGIVGAGAAGTPAVPSLFSSLPELETVPEPVLDGLAVPRSPALRLPDERRPNGALDELHAVGFLSVDLKDSTKLFHAQGVRSGYRAAAAYLDFAAAISRKHGGTIVRHTGDGGVFLFDGARGAFDAAIELQSRVQALRDSLDGPPLAFHAGVHGGRVIVHRRPEGTDAFGQSLERALELMKRSEGDDIVFADGVAEAAGLPEIKRGPRVARRRGYRLLKPAPVSESSFPEALPGAQRELARQSVEIRSTMFAALEDWTSTYDEFGRRASYATIRAYQEYMSRITFAHGGMMVKSEGEGVMLSFPTAAQALRAAAEMQREVGMLRKAAPLGSRVAIRIGLSYGKTLREETLEGVDFFGNTVNAAARLMKQAKGGEIVASARVVRDPRAAEILGTASAESDLLTLKGFKRPLRAYRVRADSVETDNSFPDLAGRLSKVVRRTLERLRRLREPRE
ncbi:MAG: hypothetical protein AUJ52_05100 [Elusimicrobia bacterium CG1_02_63_36]|nr:MAG: hypothetical protein AUJ52_05100 [Elusimicrobia bacterium CG1_02_63_36]